jgi:hypothetical protein
MGHAVGAARTPRDKVGGEGLRAPALDGARDPSGQIRTFHDSAAPGHELPFIPALYRLFLAPVPGHYERIPYLIQNWSVLRKEFGDQTPFSVIVRVIDDDPSRREVVHRYRHHG